METKRKYSASKKVDLEGKFLPQASEAETIVLGTIILEQSCFDRISKDFSVGLFWDNKNKIVAKAIIDIYKSSTPIDLITIVKKIQSYDQLQSVGGVAYISSLTQGINSSAHIEYHIKILQEEALRRNIILISNKAIQKSFDVSEDVFEVFNDIQHNLDSALKNVVNYEIRSVGQVHSQSMAESIKILHSGQKSGVASGLNLLDNVTNGWQKSDLIIIAGRPGMGKTSAVVSMALNPAVQLKTPIAIFSLEMSAEQLVARMQSQYSDVNVSKIVKKQLTEEEIIQIERRTQKLKEAPLYIDDTPNISLLELKGKVRKLVKENGVQLVIVDYLQLMRSGIKTQSREQEISEISRGLKGLAKEVSIPIIALSQLSRSVEQRGGDKKPMLSDLRESGAIEQDADMVVFCYRPEYYGLDSYEVGSNIFEAKGLFMLIIAKHRNGELGEIPLKFIGEQTKVTNYYENVSNVDNNSKFVKLNSTENNWNNIDLKPNTEFSNDFTPMDLGSTIKEESPF